MHVVIPVAVEPRNHSLPLALASIHRHTAYHPVTIGHDHGLCSHIPTIQQRARVNAFTNTDLAMRVACETDWISDPFVWSADDIYWLEPAEPIRWALGNLDDAQGDTVYTRRKRDTAELLRGRGLPSFDYESHTPLLIHKAPMLEALTLGGEKRSVYGNLTGEPDIVTADVKLRKHTDPIPDAPWVSTSRPPSTYTHLAASNLNS